jgi:hypothetical protein
MERARDQARERVIVSKREQAREGDSEREGLRDKESRNIHDQ